MERLWKLSCAMPVGRISNGSAHEVGSLTSAPLVVAKGWTDTSFDTALVGSVGARCHNGRVSEQFRRFLEVAL